SILICAAAGRAAASAMKAIKNPKSGKRERGGASMVGGEARASHFKRRARESAIATSRRSARSELLEWLQPPCPETQAVPRSAKIVASLQRFLLRRDARVAATRAAEGRSFARGAGR